MSTQFDSLVKKVIANALNDKSLPKYIGEEVADFTASLVSSALSTAFKDKDIKTRLANEIKSIISDDKIIKKLALKAVKDKMGA